MSNIYSVESGNGIRLDIHYDAHSKPDLNQLITARNFCYSAIDAITEMIEKEYPLEKEGS